MKIGKIIRIIAVVGLPLVVAGLVFMGTLPIYRSYSPLSYKTLVNPFPGHVPTPPEAVVNAIKVPDWAIQWRRWDTENVKKGEKLYQANCAGCHGKELDGRGEWALAFRFPAQPPDFRAPQSALEHHNIQHIFWRISEGGIHNLYNSAMPRWGTFGVGAGGKRETVHSGDLSEEEIWEILRYVYRATEKPPVIGQMSAGGMEGMGH